jgi:DNA-binding NtrC family response regulator
LRKYARRNARAATSLSGEAVTKLEGYPFPGNVRELENVIERAAILARGDVILPEHLAFAQRTPSWDRPLAAREPAASAPSPASSDDRASRRVSLDSQLEEIERRELIAALERSGGNKAEVARMLGVQRTTLYYRMKRLGIEI